MNDFGIGLIIGIFVGDILGVALMALLAMARDPEPPKREPEQKEPTILWTVGNICKWNGKIYEIRSLVDRNGQTEACLLSPDDAVTETIGGVLVPIEELGAVEE